MGSAMKIFKNKSFVFITLSISLVGFLAVFLFDYFGNSKSPAAAINAVSDRQPANAGTVAGSIVQKASKADPAARVMLLQWAKSDKVSEREDAASFLWRYNDDESFAALVTLAKDKNPAVRAKAYNGLSFSRESKSIAVLNGALRNKKISRLERVLINILKSRGVKSEGLDSHIKVALEHFSLTGQGTNTLSKPLINALLVVPQGREKLKEMYEKQEPQKITKKSASLTMAGVGATCPSNRFDYFKSALLSLTDADPREQISALVELRKHGAKGAEILASHVGKGSKLPNDFKVAMNKFIAEKKFKDHCEKAPVANNPQKTPSASKIPSIPKTPSSTQTPNASKGL